MISTASIRENHVQVQDKRPGRALSTALLMLLATPALAAEIDNLPELIADGVEPRESQASKPLFGSVGLALGNTGRFAGSEDRVHVLLPLVYFSYNDRLYWSLTSVGAWLLRSDDRKFHLGLMAKARGGIDGGDTRYTGIADRDASVDAGLNLTWRIQRLVLGASWLIDALGRSHGQTANLRISLPIPLNGRWTTTPSASVEWLDQKLVDYYYGVTPPETAGGAPRYTGTATTHLRAGWSLSYRINQKWRVLGGLSYTHLGAGVADSPLVSSSDNLLVYAGFTWTFGQIR